MNLHNCLSLFKFPIDMGPWSFFLFVLFNSGGSGKENSYAPSKTRPALILWHLHDVIKWLFFSQGNNCKWKCSCLLLAI